MVASAAVGSASTRPRIVVLDDWEYALERLADFSSVRAAADLSFHQQRLTGSALLAVLGGADALVLNRERTVVDAALVAAMPRLRLLVFTGPRNRHIDYEVLRARGIPVCFTEGGPALESTCEQTWSLILALTRGTEWSLQTVRGGRWRSDRPLALPAVLHGERLGLLGCGHIGARVAAVGCAFGMEVVTWSPNMTPERAARCGATAVALEELLRTSRVVSLHLVPSAATQHLIDAHRLSLMRRDAVLINTARADLLNTDALVDALRERRIAGAGLDVFLDEPLAPEHPLRSLPQVVLTPHLGFVNEISFTAFAQGIREVLEAWLAGRTLPRLVRPAAQ